MFRSQSIALVLALAMPGLGASAARATPAVTVTETDAGVRVTLVGDWAGRSYRVSRADSPDGVYTPLLQQATLCTGECFVVDGDVAPGQRLWYAFDLWSADGTASHFGPFAVVVPDPPLALRASPNPGAGPTTFALSIPGARRDAPQAVTLALYDLQGRRVRTVWDGVAPRGASTLRLDGRGDGGAPLDAGLYVARLRAGSTAVTVRVLRVR